MKDFTEEEGAMLEGLYRLLDDVASENLTVATSAALTFIRNVAFDDEETGLAICTALVKIATEVRDYYIATHESQIAVKH